MTTRLRYRLIVLGILLFPFLLFGLFYFSDLAGPPPPPAPARPVPNGYDDLVKAGGMVSSNSWHYENLNGDDLQQTAAANADALALARAALSNQCQVPLQYTMAYITNHVNDFIALRRLARAFAVESRLAEQEGRFRDAARADLDTIHLGIETAQGGVLLDQMVGTAIESIGTDDLQKLVDRLDSDTSRETASALQILDAQAQSWAQVVQQEKNWSRRTFPGMRYRLMELIASGTMKQNLQKAELKFKDQEARRSQLVIDLEKGRPPANPTDVAPADLNTLPPAPAANTNPAPAPDTNSPAAGTHLPVTATTTNLN